MGNDGSGHPAIAGGKTKVKPLNVCHGKVRKGLSVEMPLKLRVLLDMEEVKVC